MLGELEPAPGLELTRATAAAKALGQGFMRFQPVLGEAFAALVAVVVVLAGVVVDLALRQVALIAEGIEAGALGQ